MNATVSLQKKASFWYLISNIVQKGVSFIIIPFYTRILSVDEYGIYTVSDSWMELLIVIVSLNLFLNTYNVAIKKFKEIEGVSSAFCGLSILCTTLGGVVLLIGNHFFLCILGVNMWVMIAMIVYIVSHPIVMIWCTMKRFDYQYIDLVKLTVIKSILFLILGFSVVFWDKNRLIVAIYIKALVELLVGVYAVWEIAKKNNKFYNKEYWKFAISMAIPLIPYYLALRLLQHLDRIMIQHMAGDSAAAKYGLIYKITSTAMIVNTSINGAFIPWLYNNMNSVNEKMVRGVYRKLVVAILGMNVLMSLFAPEIVYVFGTREYADAIYVMTPISMASVFIFIYDQYVNMELYYEKKKMNVIFAIIISCVNALLNWIFISEFGYIAAGYTTLLSYLIFMILHVIYFTKLSKRIETIQVFSNKMIFLITLVCMVISICLPILYSYSIVRVIIGGLILVCIGMISAKYMFSHIKFDR